MNAKGKEPLGQDVKGILTHLADGNALDADTMHVALDHMTAGGATPAQMAAFLMALRVRGETVGEITGAARLLRERMVRVEAPSGAVDIVGTGGDGHSTYNVSTCAAFVVAGAGVPVAKHGNRSVSSRSGASDVLAELGVKIDIGPECVASAIRRAGVGFLWAPMYHPAMKAWAGVRSELGVRTIFNLLGPISNPAGVTRQVIGVYDRRWIVPLAETLGALESEHVWVVHGHDGLDELSTTGPSSVAELKGGRVSTFEVLPEDAGLPRAALGQLKGGDAGENARALSAVLCGAQGAYRDIVVLNAAAALIVAGRAGDLAEGAQLAAHSLDSGAARAALEKLIAVTNATT